MVNFVLRFGIPLNLNTDQGREFRGNVLKLLCEKLGIEQSCTVPYRPAADGEAERLNHTLVSYLKLYVDNFKGTNWDVHLPYLMWAYRATVHESTAFSPNVLMLWRELDRSIDISMGLPPGENEPRCKVAYVDRSCTLCGIFTSMLVIPCGLPQWRRNSTMIRVRGSECSSPVLLSGISMYHWEGKS